MSFRLIIRPRAELDVLEARSWYRDQRDGLDSEFLVALDTVIEAIALEPGRFPVVYRGFRRALLGRFPYAVFFSLGADTVFLVA